MYPKETYSYVSNTVTKYQIHCQIGSVIVNDKVIFCTDLVLNDIYQRYRVVLLLPFMVFGNIAEFVTV